MKHLRKTIIALSVVILSIRAAFADVLPDPVPNNGPSGQPMPNDYIPMVSYIVVGLGAVIVIAAVIVLVVVIRRRKIK